MCLHVCVYFHSSSSVCKYMFASILVLVCASVCSFPFFSNVYKCVFASILVLVCSLLLLFMCVQMCVRFHSSSSVFTSILVHVCAIVCSLPF